jgi:protein involved in polysaccharide export with SLBB domain
VKRKVRQLLSKLLLCTCISSSSVLSQNPQNTSTDDVPDDADLIHVGDLIEVDVLGSFEFDWRGGLNPEGFLEGMDKIESPVFALCRSESDIAADIEKQYSKILREPKINVRILDRSNRAVAYLDGAVRFPQRFQIKRTVRLNELVVLSGGITDKASGEITVFRPRSLNCRSNRSTGEEFVKTSGGNGSESLTIKISDLIRGDKDANPEILSGDIVNIAEALPIYIIGGVNAPQQLSSRSQTILSRAVASAGGVSKEGDASKVTVFRRSAEGSLVMEFDLGKIRGKQVADPALKPYDIVEVAQKGKPKRRFPPVVAGIRRVDGLAKLPLRIIE